MPALGPPELRAEGARSISLRFGRGEAEPEFHALFEGRSSSSCTWLDGDHVIADETVPISDLDTSISLRYKHVAAALRMLPGIIEKFMPPSMLNGFHAVAKPREIDSSWDEQQIARFLRASTFPPNLPPVAALPNGDRFYVETAQQLARLRKRQREEEEEARRPSKSATPEKAYVQDTHWYSNVGGTVVKIEPTSADEPVKVKHASTRDAVPGAALGRAARKKIRMNEPVIGLNAARYCMEVLSSTWIGVEGPFVKKFERAIARICGCDQACAVQSGTAALYGALKALGVSEGDHHVIVPTYTCAAAADAVVHSGGTAVGVDCELETFGLCKEAVKAAFDADPKIVGVVIAPCYGVPARDYHAIQALCEERKVWLVEDNCETYGAWMRRSADTDKIAPVGSLGTMSVVSVRSEKMVGVGEGGVILSRDSDLISKARWWCSRAPTRGAGLWRVYEHDEVGQNFRLPELLAAVGLASAEALPSNIHRKTAIHEQYAAGFAGTGLTLQGSSPVDKPVWWLNAFVLPQNSKMTAEQLGHAVMDAYPELEVRPAFYPLHWMRPFAADARPCPNAEDLYRRLFCLPSSGQLTDEDVKHVVSAVREQLSN